MSVHPFIYFCAFDSDLNVSPMIICIRTHTLILRITFDVALEDLSSILIFSSSPINFVGFEVNTCIIYLHLSPSLHHSQFIYLCQTNTIMSMCYPNGCMLCAIMTTPAWICDCKLLSGVETDAGPWTRLGVDFR